MSDRPVCNWKLDRNGFADIGALKAGYDCTFPPGFAGWVSQVTEVSPTPPTRATVSPRPKVRKLVVKEKGMEEQEPVPVPQTASVGVPAVPSASDLSKIAADAGGGSTGVLMALIAVVGGSGAVWKFLQGRNKQKHDERMKELELQADNQKRDDEKHGECKENRDAVAARIDSLDPKVTKLVDDLTSLQFSLRETQSRLSEIQSKLNTLKWPDEGLDIDEVEARFTAIEKKLKVKR